LPLLAGSNRFWGEQVLAPLGYRLEPALPESAYREALGVSANEIFLFRDGHGELIPGDAFSVVTRAGLRQLLRAHD
jgi:hypothetical protein